MISSPVLGLIYVVRKLMRMSRRNRKSIMALAITSGTDSALCSVVKLGKYRRLESHVKRY